MGLMDDSSHFRGRQIEISIPLESDYDLNRIPENVNQGSFLQRKTVKTYIFFVCRDIYIYIYICVCVLTPIPYTNNHI